MILLHICLVYYGCMLLKIFHISYDDIKRYVMLHTELDTILKTIIIDTITITQFFLIIDTTTITLNKIIVDTIQIHSYLCRYILVDTNTL